MRPGINPDRIFYTGVPTGIRTPVTGVKGQCPRPLDDGDLNEHQNVTLEERMTCELVLIMIVTEEVKKQMILPAIFSYSNTTGSRRIVSIASKAKDATSG